MSNVNRRQKRRRKIAQNLKNVRFEDLSRLLEDYGFQLKRTRGSHHSFVGIVGDQKVSVVVPYRRPLKAVYVKQVLAILDEIEPLVEIDQVDEGNIEDDE